MWGGFNVVAAPTIYRSGDASAPVLTGTAGDLVNLLDKCLCDGYTGKAAAGWTKAFTATNQRAYRQGGGDQFYLDVDDRGATSVLTGASGREAAVRGYEAMTAVSTGTNPFPTTAQVAANTANWRKSNTADAVPRGWLVIADDRTFTIFILDGDSSNVYRLYHFGDAYSIKTADGFKTCITVRTVVNSTAGTGSLNNTTTSVPNSIVGFYFARAAIGTGTSINAGYYAGSIDVNGVWPTLDGNTYLSRFLVGDTSASPNTFRGWLRGVYQMIQTIGLNDGDTFMGTGDFAGRSFVVIRGFLTTVPSMAIEATQWDTSS